MHELTTTFRFEAAHTLAREIDADGSRRIHGHSYRAEVTVRGRPDPATGMIVDAGRLSRELESVRTRLDHHMLDDVPGLGPATLENLATFVWEALSPALPGLHSVAILRDSLGERCAYYGPEDRS